MKPFLFILPAVLFSQLSFAAPASYETQLMKLSKSIKGEPASLTDRQELQLAVAQGKADEFLRQKAQNYLNTPRFTLKLKQRVDELVRVIAQTDMLNEDGYSNRNRKTAYDLFVENVIGNNLSWDQLLTGKTYRTKFPGTFAITEIDFYNRLNNIEPEEIDLSEILNRPPPTLSTFEFSPDDQRVAGILTTPRFFERYVNTALNKNRRRAAAVFRIFMCDTMIPTVPAQDTNSQNMDYDRIFPDHKNLTEGDIRKSVAGNVHGQQADCMSCHYKLDPMGQVFGFSAATVSVKPATGALRYQGNDGRKVDIPLRGIGDLGSTIVKQAEYEKCQVSYFWNWYIGKDVPLTSSREEALIKVFNDVGRKPKDFIAHLVNLPEFKEKPQLLTEDQLLARRVVKVFKNCNSCHESTGEAVWDLTDLPYHKDPRRREKMVQELREVLDTKNDGRNAEMPPEDSLWKLSPDEFDMIKNWINRGAPDFQGVPQVKAGG